MPLSFRRWFRPLAAAVALALVSSIALPATALAAEADANSTGRTTVEAQDAVSTGGEETEASTPTDTDAGAEQSESTDSESTDSELQESTSTEDDLSTTQSIQPFAASGQATITISAAAIRGTTTGLEGVTYTLHERLGTGGSNSNPYRPGTASAFSCTIPANQSSCTITVTGVNSQGGNNKNWFIVQTANPATGYDVPQYRLDSYSNPQEVFYYVGSTVQLQSTRDYVVPGGNSTTAGLLERSDTQTRASTVSVPLTNPKIVPTCEPGLKIAIQMDISSSVNNYKSSYRDSLHDLVDGLVGTGTQISLFTFGNVSPVRVSGTNWESPTPRNVDTDAEAIKNSITTFTGNQGTQRTNWDAGFQRLSEANEQYDYDLVLFITDGAPNVVRADNSNGYTDPAGNNVAVQSIDEAILSANELKNDGVRIATVGVGSGVQGEVVRNLQTVSGLTANSDYYVGQWDELGTYLQSIVEAANCSLPVTVSKTTVSEEGVTTTDAEGWDFLAEKTDGSDAEVTLRGDSEQTSGSGFNGRPKWNLDFTEPDGQTAGLTLQETSVLEGYTFTGASCTIEGTQVPAEDLEVDLQDRTVTIEGLSATSGAVHCTFTNTEQSATQLTLYKDFDTSYGAPEVEADWTLTAASAAAGTLEFEHGETQDVEPGTYTISEFLTNYPDDAISAHGYSLQQITCSTAGGEPTPLGEDQTIELAKGSVVACTLTNEDLPGSVSWLKDSALGDALADTEWDIIDPQSGAVIFSIVDNGDLDSNDASGQFEVVGLTWGEYALVETKAAPGFALPDPSDPDNWHRFTITGTTASATVGLEVAFTEAFTNTPLNPGTLPLTGAFSGMLPYLAGVALLAVLAAGWYVLRRGERVQAPLLDD